MKEENKDLISRLTDYFLESIYNPSAVASFAAIDRTGYMLGEKQGVCHAALNRLVKRPVYLIDGYQLFGSSVTTRAHRRFLEWVLAESVFSEVFLDKSVDNYINKRYVIIDCKKSADLIASACCTLRLATELTGVVNTWTKLVDVGFSPEVALLYSGRLGIVSYTEKYLCCVPYTISSHHPFAGYNLSRSALKNYLRGVTRPEAVKKTYHSMGRYDGMCRVWGYVHNHHYGHGDPCESLELLKEIASRTKPKDWGKELQVELNLNPWADADNARGRGRAISSAKLKGSANHRFVKIEDLKKKLEDLKNEQD